MHFIRRHRLHQVRVAGQHLLYRRRPSLEPGLQGLDGRRALCRVAQDYGNTALKINLGVGGLNPPEVAERYIRAARALTRAGEARQPERGVAQEGPHVPVIFEHASVAGGGAVLLRMFMPRSDALARFPRYPAHLSQRSGEGAPWQMTSISGPLVGDQHGYAAPITVEVRGMVVSVPPGTSRGDVLAVLSAAYGPAAPGSTATAM